jgi:hypothetical protein
MHGTYSMAIDTAGRSGRQIGSDHACSVFGHIVDDYFLQAGSLPQS